LNADNDSKEDDDGVKNSDDGSITISNIVPSSPPLRLIVANTHNLN